MFAIAAQRVTDQGGFTVSESIPVFYVNAISKSEAEKIADFILGEGELHISAEEI